MNCFPTIVIVALLQVDGGIVASTLLKPNINTRPRPSLWVVYNSSSGDEKVVAANGLIPLEGCTLDRSRCVAVKCREIGNTSTCYLCGSSIYLEIDSQLFAVKWDGGSPDWGDVTHVAWVESQLEVLVQSRTKPAEWRQLFYSVSEKKCIIAYPQQSQ